MKIGKIASGVGRFFAKNGRSIGAMVATAFAYALNDRFTAPIQSPTAGKSNGQAQIIYFPPRNAAEAAIDALRQSAASMWSESDRLKVAKDIIAIASGPNLDDQTRAYAIMALTEISNDMRSDTCKRQVTNLIVQLSRGGA